MKEATIIQMSGVCAEGISGEEASKIGNLSRLSGTVRRSKFKLLSKA
jgi:hypothetical protein